MRDDAESAGSGDGGGGDDGRGDGDGEEGGRSAKESPARRLNRIWTTGEIR